ncbi:hypothetical protein LJC44_02870 [Parabacteroides sp. OttesenSCG-928-G06]|nr:hypothetical protein [Parabacteroides sp. OttesenSCG-928-G06]
MANKVRVDYLLLDIRELEKKVAGIRDAEIYPVSFFSQAFEMAHKILTDLNNLEAEQLELLNRQMEVHRLRLQSITPPVAHQQPAIQQEEMPVMDIEEEEFPYTCPYKEDNEERETDVKYEETPESERANVSLNDILEKNNLADLRKAFSLNDQFRFRRELFGGDELKMSLAIADLNKLQSYEDSVVYLQEELLWDLEEPAVADFLLLIEKRFL